MCVCLLDGVLSRCLRCPPSKDKSYCNVGRTWIFSRSTAKGWVGPRNYRNRNIRGIILNFFSSLLAVPKITRAELDKIKVGGGALSFGKMTGTGEPWQQKHWEILFFHTTRETNYIFFFLIRCYLSGSLFNIFCSRHVPGGALQCDGLEMERN